MKKILVVTLILSFLLVLSFQIISSEENNYNLKYHPFYLLEKFQTDSNFPNDLTPKTDEEIINSVLEDKFPKTKYGARIK